MKDLRKSFVIENIESGERYLLPLKQFVYNGIPKGFKRITSKIPLMEEYFQTVKNLPIFESEGE